ncbi:MAG: 16S rRNA (guanine(527)-N(7))-methyltransferase RsmG [Chloroflexota bacterium]|nr:MAG: 16S rRNA (guanine(527)-N(7))-methyltransferase RsmG [Chloroflexota bacterium]UCF28387.1 MAG: 16S rRNA (guanine(527)-N(7))-methyltransferase RsmG [Chloroflexota bacterium]
MHELVEYAWNLLGIQISEDQLSAFEVYEQQLIEWNDRYNLTAIDNPKQIRVKHFLDSLSCILALRNTPTDHVVDVGTGAGFPGLPLKIICPTINMTLIESVGKKTAFCQHIIQTINLQNVNILQERAEILASHPDMREKNDWAIARAVATLPVLVEYLLPLVRVGGFALAMKGESGPAEAQSAEQAIHILGGQIQQLIPVTLPSVEDERYLVVIEKTAATPERYPRRVGIPAKRPLGAD